MSDARSNILAKLSVPSSSRRTGAHSMGEKYRPPKAILPAFVASYEHLATLLKDKIQACHASVDIAHTAKQTGRSIAQFIKANKADKSIAVTGVIDRQNVSVKGIDFYRAKDISTCQTIITQAALGVAETGSLLLPSTPERPCLANFLPENCIVLLNSTDIVAYLEQGLMQVKTSKKGMPRVLNIVSGPSKTADIEQTLIYGAHGPKRLHLIIQEFQD